MKTISLLGSGWLGLVLARFFVQQGYRVHASTRSELRFPELVSCRAKPFKIDIEVCDAQSNDYHGFLDSDILIVNITSKHMNGFARLISEIGQSSISKVLFVSSTSVYANTNGVVLESDGAEIADHPLLLIEHLFQSEASFDSTIIRFGGLFGYARHPGRFFSAGKIIQQPDAPVNMIHRDDCVNIVGRIVEQGIWGEVFNACANTHPSKRDFYTRASISLGQAAPTLSDSGTGEYKVVSNAKLKQALNYEFVRGDLLQVDFDPAN